MKRLRDPEAVLFDMDGTLVDNSLILYECQVVVFERYSVPAPSFEEYWTTMNPPFESWYRERGVTADFATIERIFSAHYLQVMHRAQLMPYAHEVIHELLRRSVPIGIVSGNSEANIRQKLERFGIATAFAHVHGGTLDKAPNIRLIVGELGVDPSKTLFVGDRPSDVRDAMSAGVVPIGFTGGHPTETFLRREGHADVQIIHSLREILDLHFVRP